MKKIKALAILNAIAFILQVVSAYLVQAGVVNGRTVGDVAAKYESLFTPADMTFSIWGVIYTMVGMLCLYHIVIAFKHPKDNPSNNDLLNIGNRFVLLNLGGAAWMWAWVNEELFISVVLIYFQLLCLVAIHKRLFIYDPLRSAASKVSTQVPLSIYLGWMSIAAIANSSAFLSATGWGGFGLSDMQWAISLIFIAVIISLVMIFGYRNIYFGLAVTWGIYGINVKRSSLDDGAPYAMLVFVSGIAIAILLLSCLVQLIRNASYKAPRPLFPVTPALK